MDNGESSYRRYLDGDESAFAEIEKMYFEHLTMFINRFVHDTEAAKDLAIDTLVELVVNPRRYNFKFSIKTYIFAIGRHKALNYAKRRKIVVMTELKEEISDSAEKSPDSIAELHDVKVRVKSAVESLPPDMQTAVYLVYFENMSCDETAKIMKKNRKQIYNILYRAKIHLKEILGKDGEIFEY